MPFGFRKETLVTRGMKEEDIIPSEMSDAERAQHGLTPAWDLKKQTHNYRTYMKTESSGA